MSLLNNLEREELLGGLRGVPLRMLPALATTVLLYVSGDALAAWPLAWVALLPLCFACRGAGPLAALLLALVSFGGAATAQGYWLLDVEGAAPFTAMLCATVFPALAFFAIELPICRKIPWALRPLLLTILATGLWALLPRDARMLIPGGGLIDSELAGVVYPQLGLASMAGILSGLGWLAAELFVTPRLRFPKRSGWGGLVFALVLVAVGGIDWVGSLGTPEFGTRDTQRVYVVTDREHLLAASEKALQGVRGSPVVIWRPVELKNPAERDEWVSRGGDFAKRRGVKLVEVLTGPFNTYAYVFNRGERPVAASSWSGRPGRITGEPLKLDGAGQLSVYPSLRSGNHWSTQWSVEIYTTPLEPLNRAQQRFWLREQRREAMVRGSRQICVWPGGGAAIDGNGQVLASDFEDGTFSARLPAAMGMGEALGKPRQQFIELILRFSSPVLVLMLILLTPVAWAKRRYYARRQSALSVAIEELPNEQTTLTKEETESITKSYKRE